MRFRLMFAAATGLWGLALWGCAVNSTKPIPLPPLSAVEVSPATDTLRVGEFKSFSAAALDTLGAIVGGASFTWRSRNTAVFTVSSLGRVRGIGEGGAWLVAEAGGKTDSAWVAVVPTQSGWFTQASNANGANLRDVFFLPDGRTGWAVGDAGKILFTDDAGVTWTSQTSFSSFSLYGVWCTSATEAWAVGVNGTVLHTTDAGDHWSRVTTVSASETLKDVHFASRDTGWAVGSNGLVLRTFDRGVTWQKTYPTTQALHSVSFFGARDGWAVGDGVIVGTHDRGLTWFVVQPNVTSQSVRGVWRRSEPMTVAVGTQGVVPRTMSTPDSTSWTLLNAGAAYQLEGVQFPNDAIGYAVGFSGTGAVLRSDDGGFSWMTQAANTQFRLNDVFFVDSNRGWAVGDQGTIIHTADGGTP